MKTHGLSVGDIVKGRKVMFFYTIGDHDKCKVKCVKCGHLRSYPTLDFSRGVEKCVKCKRLKDAKKKIGKTFGAMVVKDVRVGRSDNTFAECECGHKQWYPWSTLRNMVSCGCSRKKNKKTKLRLRDVKKLFYYDPESGLLTEKKDCNVVNTPMVLIGGRRYKTLNICWFLAHGKYPRYLVSGITQKKCDLVCSYTNKRAKKGKFSALAARGAGICHQDKLCKHYRNCGDLDFECACRGYKMKDDDWRYKSHARGIV